MTCYNRDWYDTHGNYDVHDNYGARELRHTLTPRPSQRQPISFKSCPRVRSADLCKPLDYVSREASGLRRTTSGNAPALGLSRGALCHPGPAAEAVTSGDVRTRAQLSVSLAGSQRQDFTLLWPQGSAASAWAVTSQPTSRPANVTVRHVTARPRHRETEKPGLAAPKAPALETGGCVVGTLALLSLCCRLQHVRQCGGKEQGRALATSSLTPLLFSLPAFANAVPSAQSTVPSLLFQALLPLHTPALGKLACAAPPALSPSPLRQGVHISPVSMTSSRHLSASPGPPSGSGGYRRPLGLRVWPAGRGGAARAQQARREVGSPRDMGAAGLARRLRGALREEEPRAVEELLQRGADPNLVLADGAAAVHLAAGARDPRGLRCLGVLLRGGGDPNVRSAEALTPLHVAAAWGCRRSLELLLSHGADPALRDQDGLRALDLALRQGHRDCVRVLRDFHARTGIPENEPRGTSERPCVTADSSALQTQLGRDTDLEVDPGAPSLPVPLEVGDQDGSSEVPNGCGDCSSDASFVTAVEVSGADTDLDRTSAWGRPLPQTRHESLGDCLPENIPSAVGGLALCHGARMADRDTELNIRLQALTLTSPDAAGLLPSPSFPSHSPQQGPPPGAPEFYNLPEDQTSFHSDVDALWLTEDEASITGNGDSVLSCQYLPNPAMSDLELLRGLRALGQSPGPITPFTRPYYLRRLEEAQTAPGPDFSGHSPELAKALLTGRIPDAQADEDALAQQFERPNPRKRWREGTVKSSFTYLLLDPRETQDLPARSFSLTPAKRLQTFVRAIFYVGKGTRARPNVHLCEALGYRGRPGKQACPKVRQILDIWDSGRGVVSLHCFRHVVAVEAYTREACLMDALGIQTLTNQKQGHYYGVVASWSPARRQRLGVHLLHRALLVFLAEGERELRPQDIQAHG
ncbi:ankyrin repeat and LEM domain-containing protein 1 [Castor canadensis]|uniref:Ankyrin repeat and LEM domain-containing protein 1 n=1 Tax=Castor canadensis TaxID=51338 RepID=A0A8B7VPC3_CASCN